MVIDIEHVTGDLIIGNRYDRTTATRGCDRLIVYPFDRYEILIKLTWDNKFVSIMGIQLNKKFKEHLMKITPKGYHDVDEYYKD
jgi:hypothetical protein